MNDILKPDGIFKVPHRTLERFLCDDLPFDQAVLVGKAMESSPQLAAYIKKRKQERETFANQQPFALVLKQLETHSKFALFGFFSQKRIGWLAVAMATMLLVVGGMVMWPSPKMVIGVRGDFKVVVMVKRQDRVFEYNSDVLLRPGDRLRLQIEDSRGGYGWVLGLTDRRQIAVYYGNDSQGRPMKIRAGIQMLPDSLELDDSLDNELLVVVISDKVFSNDQLRKWLQEASWKDNFTPTLKSLEQARVVTLRLQKEGQ